MAVLNSDRGWGWPARLLHWTMAAIILFMLGLGFYMTEIVTDIYEQFGLVQLHKSWGFTVFVLALIRIVWRALNPAPPMPEHMASHERWSAHGAHVTLYALMIVMPVSGWLMASASDLQEMYSIRNMVFGLFEMPDPFQPGDKALEAVFASIHFWSAILLSGIVALHIGAALKHQGVDRDGLLRRMIRGA